MQELFNENGIAIYAADTPEDYTRMFSVPCGSCMVMPTSPEATFGGQKMWLPIMAKYGLHPAAWYHYTGYSQGVWLEVLGKPLARCMRYRAIECWNSDGSITYEPWSMVGDPHYASGLAADYLLRFMVEKLELQPAMRLGINKVSTLNGFDIPALELDGEYYCPLAHSDFNAKDFRVAFFPEGTNPQAPGGPTFRFMPEHLGPNKKTFLRVHSTYDWDGYIPASVLNKRIEETQQFFDNMRTTTRKWSRNKHEVGSRKNRTAVTQTA